MATIRAKLTVAYAGALLGSVAVYSVALYGERRSNARREIQREVAVQADVALRVLRFAATANEPMTSTTLQVVGAGSQQFVQPITQITPRIATILDGLQDYVVLMDTTGKPLYLSPAIRQLRTRDPSSGDYDRLMQQAVATPPGNSTFPVLVGNASVLLVALPETDPTTVVSRVVAGREVDLTADWLREFLATMLGRGTADHWRIGWWRVPHCWQSSGAGRPNDQRGGSHHRRSEPSPPIAGGDHR